MSSAGYTMLKLVRAGYVGVNSCSKLAIGYSMSSGKSACKEAQQQCFDQSAHVLKVVMKCRKFELEGPTRTNFVLRHEEYTHPRVILQEDTTLMAIDHEYAIFSICSKDVFAHTTGPFAYINQFNHCTKLVIIPLKFFNQLADEVGDPPGNLILLSNTGRCGSTLLTQLFETMPNTVAISEPEVLVTFGHEALFADLPRPQQLELLRSCIRMLCKSARVNGDGLEPTILIKPKAHCIGLTKDLSEVYPDMKHLYMYRHPAEYVHSIISVYRSLMHPVVRSLLLYISVGMSMKEFIMRQFPREPDTKPSKFELTLLESINNLDFHSYFNRFAALFCGNLLKMMQLSKDEDIKFHIVSYHELTNDTEAQMKRILHHCGMDRLLNFRFKIPERDSQNNSGLSRSRLRSYRADQQTEKEISEIDAVLKSCGFPLCQNFPIKSQDLVQELDL